jgi:hypothetical protein
MIDHVEVTRPSVTGAQSSERLSQEGLVAGLLGAATIALWFLLLDALRGRPLLTPSLLGTAIFGGGAGLDAPASLTVSMEMVVLYTWVHALVFAVVGGVAARLLAIAERRPHVGFGILLLFVVFEFGFLLAAMLFAEPVLRVLTWPAVLAGNLVAAVVMGAYLWRRHPGLTIWP